MTKMTKLNPFALAAAGLAMIYAAPAAADAVADFYSGKTVTLIVGSGAGGGFGLNGRLGGNRLGRHIPGKPTVVLQFMQGGGGVKAANFVYNVAPKTGVVIHMPISSIVENQLLRPTGVRYDGAKFNWLGSITSFTSVLSVWHTAPAKSIGDAMKRQIILGSPSGHSFIYRMPKLMNTLLGTKFKIIVGYKGSRGVDMALERGEIQGRAMVWASTKAKQPDWLKQGKLVHLIQIGPKAVPDLPGLPRFIDLVKGKKEKAMVKFLHTTSFIGRALLAPPGTPKDRVAGLRKAFDGAVSDAAYVSDLKKRKLPLRPTSGKDLQAFIVSVSATSPELIAELRKAVNPKGAQRAKRKKK